nr:hypothetical protein [Parachlamydiaceae bacterium]
GGAFGGAGGENNGSGGGGAGLGGAIFVRSKGRLTLTHVSFIGNSTIAGQGGEGMDDRAKDGVAGDVVFVMCDGRLIQH